MTLHAVWTPGYTAQPQFVGPGALVQIGNLLSSDIVGLRQVSGVTFQLQNGTDNVFHFAIPTPVIVNGARAKLRRVFVLFNADPGVQLHLVTVSDGATLMETFSPPPVTGIHSGFPLTEAVNAFTLITLTPTVFFGIGVSAHVRCLPGANASITFASAGADFDI